MRPRSRRLLCEGIGCPLLLLGSRLLTKPGFRRAGSLSPLTTSRHITLLLRTRVSISIRLAFHFFSIPIRFPFDSQAIPTLFHSTPVPPTPHAGIEETERRCVISPRHGPCVTRGCDGFCCCTRGSAWAASVFSDSPDVPVQSCKAEVRPAGPMKQLSVRQKYCVLRLESFSWAGMDVVKRPRYGRFVIYMI